MISTFLEYSTAQHILGTGELTLKLGGSGTREPNQMDS